MQTQQQLRDHKQRMLANPTPSEALFERKLKAAGIEYTKQSIVGFYIVDFAIPSKMLIIEIDGSIHDFQREYDAQRDKFLSRWFTVARVRNEDVDSLDIQEFVAGFPDAPLLTKYGKNPWLSAIAKAHNKKRTEPVRRIQKAQIREAEKRQEFRGLSRKKIRRKLRGSGVLKKKLSHLSAEEINRCYSEPIVDPTEKRRGVKPLLWKKH